MEVDNLDSAEGEISNVKKLRLRALQREKALANYDKSGGGRLSPTSSGSGGGGGGGDGMIIGADFSNMKLKEDHIQRPCWTCPDGTINLEAFHDL